LIDSLWQRFVNVINTPGSWFTKALTQNIKLGNYFKAIKLWNSWFYAQKSKNSTIRICTWKIFCQL